MANLPNRLLEGLSRADAAALQPHLKNVQLQQKQTIHAMGEPITRAYFRRAR